MPEIRIEGSHPLKGETEVQGSKNAVLPILAASVFIRGTVVLTHVPDIGDVSASLTLLRNLGASVSFEAGTVRLDTSGIQEIDLTDGCTACLRSSVLFLGSLLGAFGKAVIGYPGGCAIGKRPVDLHLMALERLGAMITLPEGKIRAEARELVGAGIHFPFPSVGATEQAILAAVCARGKTVISGAAREPEIGTLCDFLNRCGAEIIGAGTDIISVTGTKLSGCSYEIPGDRIAAATYLAAAAASGGEIAVSGVAPEQMKAGLLVLSRMGCETKIQGNRIRLRRRGALRAVPLLETAPYPGFPTDMQSLFLPLLCMAEGESLVRENIFEDRLKLAKELRRMGADLRISGCTAYVRGPGRLAGAAVTASDLRSAAGLIVAALGARGESRISGIRYLRRGYEKMEETLRSLGAAVRTEILPDDKA